MINIMFWNVGLNRDEVNKNVINDIILKLLTAYDIDILLLAEYPCNMDTLCERASAGNRTYKVGPIARDIRVKLLLDRKLTAELIRDSAFHFLCQIKSRELDFLLTGIHLSSQLYCDKDDLTVEAVEVVDDIKESEEQMGSDRCLIIGDFNLDPFDRAMVSCNAFHAIPFSEIVQTKKSRTFAGKKYQMFYNPMWNFMGDMNGKGSTYYYNSSNSFNLYGHIFDQVLISAPLIEFFEPSSLEIVSEFDEFKLTRANGIPYGEKYSDHLPIKVSLNESPMGD